jgi:methylated-DNA-protein-cysteine methyltransferase-like protein
MIASPKGSYERIYAVIQAIPRGRVATYGQIAELAALPGHARQVGYALHRLPDGSHIPWHRVINVRGEISRHSDDTIRAVQRHILEAEGVQFNDRGTVPLERFRWRPRRTNNEA